MAKKLSFDDWSSDSSSTTSVDFSQELKYRFWENEEHGGRYSENRGLVWNLPTEAEIRKFATGGEEGTTSKASSAHDNKVSAKQGASTSGGGGGGDTGSHQGEFTTLPSTAMSESGDAGLKATSPAFRRPVRGRARRPLHTPVQTTFTLRDFNIPFTSKEIRRLELEIPMQTKGLLANIPVLPLLAETRSVSAPPKLTITNPFLERRCARKNRVRAIDLIPSYSAPGRLNTEEPAYRRNSPESRARSFVESPSLIRANRFLAPNIPLLGEALKSATLDYQRNEDTTQCTIPDSPLGTSPVRSPTGAIPKLNRPRCLGKFFFSDPNSTETFNFPDFHAPPKRNPARASDSVKSSKSAQPSGATGAGNGTSLKSPPTPTVSSKIREETVGSIMLDSVLSKVVGATRCRKPSSAPHTLPGTSRGDVAQPIGPRRLSAVSTHPNSGGSSCGSKSSGPKPKLATAGQPSKLAQASCQAGIATTPKSSKTHVVTTRTTRTAAGTTVTVVHRNIQKGSGSPVVKTRTEIKKPASKVPSKPKST